MVEFGRKYRGKPCLTTGKNNILSDHTAAFESCSYAAVAQQERIRTADLEEQGFTAWCIYKDAVVKASWQKILNEQLRECCGLFNTRFSITSPNFTLLTLSRYSRAPFSIPPSFQRIAKHTMFTPLNDTSCPRFSLVERSTDWRMWFVITVRTLKEVLCKETLCQCA